AAGIDLRGKGVAFVGLIRIYSKISSLGTSRISSSRSSVPAVLAPRDHPRAEDHPPVAQHFHGPITYQGPFQWVEISARKAHIFYLMGRVEPIKNVGELLGMAQVNPALTPLIEEIFEPLMGMVV